LDGENSANTAVQSYAVISDNRRMAKI